jgi:hypothetical protein
MLIKLCRTGIWAFLEKYGLGCIGSRRVRCGATSLVLQKTCSLCPYGVPLVSLCNRAKLLDCMDPQRIGGVPHIGWMVPCRVP